MRGVVALIALAGCVQSNSILCDDGLTCPSDQVCDVAHGGCVFPAQLTACNALDDGMPCTVQATDDGICDQHVCREKFCGDNHVDDTEQCDGTATSTLTCKNFGFYDDVKPACTDACKYDLTGCTGFCGDAVVSGPEICEPTIAPTKTCIDYGYGAGPLGCDACGPDVRSCETLGWDVLDVSSQLSDVHGLADNDIYGAASGGLFHFDGTAWSKVNVGACNDLNLRWVYEAAPGVVFAASGNGALLGRVLRIENGSCTAYQTANNSVISGVFATSATDAWVAAEGFGLYHFNGTSWTQVYAGGARDIWGTAPNNIYAVVTAQPNSLLHYDGTSWTPVAGYPSATLPIAEYVWGTSSTNLFVAGLNNSNAPVLLHYDGSTFSTLTGLAPFSPGRYYGGSAVGSRMVMQLASTTFVPYIVEYDSSSFANLRTPNSGTVSAVWMAPSGNVYTGFSSSSAVLRLARNAINVMPSLWTSGLASSIQARTQNDALLFTASGVMRFNGVSWSLVSATSSFYDSAIDPAGNIFAISFQSGLWRPNGAGGYMTDATPTGISLAAVATNDVWIIEGGSKSIARWLNGTVSSPPSVSAMLGNNEALADIWGSSPSNVIVTTNQGAVLKFNGTSWSKLQTPVTSALLGIWGVSPTSVYIGGASGTIYHYDGTSVTAMSVPANVVNAIWGRSDDDLFAATSSALLHFDGTQWSPVDIASPHPIYSMSGVGDSVFFADWGRGVTQLVRLGSWAH